MKKIYLLFLLTSFIGFSQNPGDLVISEILQNPAGSDADGEYFELYNTTSTDIDIEGWTIKDGDAGNPNIHVISNGGPLLVPANSYLSLGRNGDTSVNGGFNHAYIYEDFFLGNGGDEVIIETPGGVVIDEVVYTGSNPWPDPNGPSMQLDVNFLNSTDNDDGLNWCESEMDYGTPGAANVTCAPTCQTFLGANDEVCDSINPGDSDDTYTVSLDYNGAATGETFVVSTTPSGYTIGGDDPTNVAEGTITVSGVPEGTGITITVSNIADGGLCELSRDIESPICAPAGDVELEIQGVIDFTVLEGGSSGKAVHLVATADIADLSEYSVAVASNGGGSFGGEFVFPQQAVANGEHILLARDLAAMEAFMTTAGYNLFDYQIEATSSVTQNGDDAVGLFKNEIEVEVFGDPNVDGTGEAWEYTDSWAYKNVTGAVWPADWIYGGVNCTDFNPDDVPPTWTIFDTPCVYPFLSSLSNEQFEIEGLKIYPNPVRGGIVNINSSLDSEIEVEIYDMLGRNVLSGKLTNDRLNVSSLERGVYLVKVTAENKSSTRKIMIE